MHTGFNIWEKILDNNIYHVIIYYISERMNNYINENTTFEEKETDNRINNIIYYIKMMMSRMIIDKYPRKYERYYKDNIDSLKMKFADFKDFE